MNLRAPKSLITLALCCVFYFYSPFLNKRWEYKSFNAVISWDIFGYYFYLPSLFYDDLGKLTKYDYIQETYHPAGDVKDMAFLQPTGYYVMNYPCGQAIMYLPAFGFAHCWAIATHDRVDGFTLPYQLSMAFWCIIVACFGLWILRLLLLRYWDDWLVAVAIGVLCLATNLYCFVSFSPLTHAYLFTLFVSITYLTDSFFVRAKHKWWYMLVIGIMSGLATITRPTDIIVVFIPLLWGVATFAQFKQRLHFLFTSPKYSMPYVIGAIVAALPQLIYWKICAGHWLFFSYHGSDKTFSFLSPHIWDGLFSFRKGWFTYTPVMLFSIVGFYPLFRYYRSIFWGILVFTLVNVYLVFSWDIWWYGGSFSQRAVIESYALLVFPLAAFIRWTFESKYARYPVIALLLFCTWLNICMTYQANVWWIADTENTNCAYYWRIFGKTTVTEDDLKLLDNWQQVPKGIERSLSVIYQSDLEDQSAAIYEYAASGQKVLMVDKNIPWSDAVCIKVPHITRGWFRAYAKIYFDTKESNRWAQTQFFVDLYQNDTSVNRRFIKPERILGAGKWQEIYTDILVPKGKTVDQVKVYLINCGTKLPIYADDIKIAYTPEE